MTEKTKSTNSNTSSNNTFNNKIAAQLNPAQVEKTDIDKQFLEKTNVKAILNNLLESLYHHQPEDPLNYICNYFENLNQIGDPVKLAHERLKSLNHTSAAFDECVFDVYQIFLKAATTPPQTKKAPKIYLGDLFNKLIDLLASDILTDIRTMLTNKLRRKNHDAFSFQLFKSSVKLVCLCKEYISECTMLYNDLDTYSAGNHVNEKFCSILLSQLKKSLEISSLKEQNPQNSIECLYELSPSGISQTLSEKYSSRQEIREAITLDDFLIISSRSFIASIKL